MLAAPIAASPVSMAPANMPKPTRNGHSPARTPTPEKTSSAAARIESVSAMRGHPIAGRLLQPHFGRLQDVLAREAQVQRLARPVDALDDLRRDEQQPARDRKTHV